MPSVLKSTLTPNVSTETVVYAPGGTVIAATLIGILVANNNDVGAQKTTIRIKRGAVFCNVAKQAPLPLADTFVPSGFEGKVVLMGNDELRVSVDVGTADVTVSYLEQT